ncbi:hypothetical protein ECMP0209401_5352 [Escherichia coli MP020940.1]|nr:hypothetical protein ECMP02155212_5348 [Escherichia coli MP021552.12]EMU68700.1 hypothetical protein ECMP02155211_5168 [Escherichia coli MP021552.11]EMW42236.1 hypothetical protein EC2780750_5313 [Escherichia coli 2780750]EMX26225.1 hypothetical protein ECMP0215612_5501 [Escherichia coli MP021561.2]EMX44403.1 hypothetical protein ECMP0209401_5352 [Escherichia coli MP020940.1]EMZ99921.1 hypothetical protein ECP03048161_5524 [Escherichia coli P0304816.1]ENB01091.1 hypothetical protein EC2864
MYLQNPPRHARHTGETHALNLNQPSQLCRLLKNWHIQFDNYP